MPLSYKLNDGPYKDKMQVNAIEQDLCRYICKARSDSGIYHIFLIEYREFYQFFIICMVCLI